MYQFASLCEAGQERDIGWHVYYYCYLDDVIINGINLERSRRKDLTLQRTLELCAITQERTISLTVTI